jgi:ectoine hydroxylase-related dioxygenase (phytanoyl-CoA dioxygenase family)
MNARLPPGAVGKDMIEQYRRDGAVPIRGAFKDWVEVLRCGIERNLANPSSDARIYDTAGGGRFFNDYCGWSRIPEYKDFIFNSPAAAIAAALMGAKTVRLFHDHVLVKEPGADTPTPWHQDAPYYSVEGPQTCSLWIPLDRVPRERTVEFIAGSQAWGKLYKPMRFNKAALNENDGLEMLPDIDADRSQYDILAWPLEPGDAVAFQYTTIHGAPANLSKAERRRAISIRVVGDHPRYRRVEGVVTSPPMRDVTLPHGAALDGPQFPVLFGG